MASRLLLLSLVLVLFTHKTVSAIKLLYTSDVSGHLFEVDGDGRTCTRYWNNGSLASNSGQYQPIHSCSGGAAGRQHFITSYYAANNNHQDVVLLDTGNHFYGSREYFYKQNDDANAKKIATFAKKLNYDAMSLSSKDLHAEQNEINAFVTEMATGNVPFVASNLVVDQTAATEDQKDLYDLVNGINGDAPKIKKWHVVTTTNNDQILIFSLLPKDAVLRSRCLDTSVQGSVQVLGQNSNSEEWLMSQVSHLNRLWEEVQNTYNPTTSIKYDPTYAILIADLPMTQVITLTRVLSFINVGIGAFAPTQKSGVCKPSTMTNTNCAPLNGQPISVSSETGIPREMNGNGAATSGFFLSHVTAPMDVPTYTNATWLETRNGRSVGVFEHDLTTTFELGTNPWGNMYQVNNPVWSTPLNLLDSTNIRQDWLNNKDATTSAEIDGIAKLIGIQQKVDIDTKPQGIVSQPVYGEALGTQVYLNNRFREVGCSQADCPMGRLFLNAMLGAAHENKLCPTGDNQPWCIAIVNGDLFATSVSSYGQSWRDGRDPFDQRGLRPPDENDKEEKITGFEDASDEAKDVERQRKQGTGATMADMQDTNFPDTTSSTFESNSANNGGGTFTCGENGDESCDDDETNGESGYGGGYGGGYGYGDGYGTVESNSANGVRRLFVDEKKHLEGQVKDWFPVIRRILAPVDPVDPKDDTGTGTDSDDTGDNADPVDPVEAEKEKVKEKEKEKKEKAKEKKKEKEKEEAAKALDPDNPAYITGPDKGKQVQTSTGIKRLPDYTDAPSSYTLSENDLRAAYPWSYDAVTEQPRKSDQLYYIDIDIQILSRLFVKQLKAWNYQTKNFGTFLTAGTSAPYAPSWRIRRTPAQWPMINDVPPKQKIRLIGTYHDLTLGPYWDGYSQTHNGKGPPVNIIAQGAKPIHFDATNTGKTTAAHAVGLFLRREMYKKIDGPWVNAFISKKDENFMKEVQENLPSYVFDDTVNCTKHNEHDALLGDYCNNVVYDVLQDATPFVTPGKQNIYVAYPNRTRLVAHFTTQLDILNAAVQRFRIVIGGLPKTDVFLKGTNTVFNGGFSSLKPDIIANDNKIGTAPSAILGPFDKAGRRRLKTKSAGVGDKYIQLRYDSTSEDDSTIPIENGGKTIFFGSTRKDRTHALRTMMRQNNWTAATILHQSKYNENAGVSCQTLSTMFGCDCKTDSKADSVALPGPRKTKKERFWCINVEHKNYQGWCEGGFGEGSCRQKKHNDASKMDRMTQMMFAEKLGIPESTRLSRKFYSTEVDAETGFGGGTRFGSRYNSSSSKREPNIYILMINNETILNNVMSHAQQLGMLDCNQANEIYTTSKNWIHADSPKGCRNNKIFIVYESVMLESPSISKYAPLRNQLQKLDGKPPLKKEDGEMEKGSWILGLGRVSTSDSVANEPISDIETGKIKTTSDELIINGYEASIGYIHGLNGVYSLLLNLDGKKRDTILLGQNTVHGNIDTLVNAYLSRFPVKKSLTGLHNDIQMGHPRCVVIQKCSKI